MIESAGIPTVSISLLKEVTRKVKPPRALFVDFPLGYPLGEPDNPSLQKTILLEALQLLTRNHPLPILESFQSGAHNS